MYFFSLSHFNNVGAMVWCNEFVLLYLSEIFINEKKNDLESER